MGLLVFARVHSDSIKFICIYLDSLRFTLGSLWFTSVKSGSLRFYRFHFEFTWVHSGSHGFTQVHTGSLGFTRVHSGASKGKGLPSGLFSSKRDTAPVQCGVSGVKVGLSRKG